MIVDDVGNSWSKIKKIQGLKSYRVIKSITMIQSASTMYIAIIYLEYSLSHQSNPMWYLQERYLQTHQNLNIYLRLLHWMLL